MTKRAPVSVQRPIWYDAQQVDETDLNSEQTANETIESSIINNHIGSGVLPEVLVQNVLFNSATVVGYLDGLAINAQTQPSDNNLGNQLTITLSGSNASGSKKVKVCIIGTDFQDNLQYEIFYFDTNESQTSTKHFTNILVLLFNDFIGNPELSFNLGGTIVIAEANPMTLSRDTLMVAQDQQPNLFFRDFFLDFSISSLSLQAFLQSAMPNYNISTLNIFTQPLDVVPILSGDVTTQIGQKFQATTNNIQQVTLLLSVRNTAVGHETDLAWTGDIIVSIYPLQSSVSCPTDIAPGLPIEFSPTNIPLAQISYNYSSLQAVGVVLDSVAQPIDFIFSNSPIAGGNVISAGNYYAVTIKRSGAANQCDILVNVGQSLVTNSLMTTFNGNLWVDISNEDLWFRIWTDAAKVSDGQAYDAGNGVIIPKTTLNPTTQATIDYNFGQLPFIGNTVYGAVLAAVTEDSVEVPDQRTGNNINSRQQYEPQVTLMTPVNITNLEVASEPLILGTVTDQNIKSFNPSLALINSFLYSATMAGDELLIRIVDDPTDVVRFNTLVSGLASSLLNGALINAQIIPDAATPSLIYRIAEASLCSMITGDVDGNGIIDDNDLALLNSYLGYNLNIGLPLHTSIVTVGPVTTVTNGYTTLTQPFANLYDIGFLLIDPNTGFTVASGTDGVCVANPNDPRSAQFTSTSVLFNTIIGLSSYQLVILSNGAGEADWGAWTITGLDALADVLTISKVYLTGDALGQMLRADIDGDFMITSLDGYLLNDYVSRLPTSDAPHTTYPAPATNPYTKIGTRFNVIKLRLEEFTDRTDDYNAFASNLRSQDVHPTQNIFAADGYFYNHNFYTSPIAIAITSQLSWLESLVVSSTQSKLVPSVFTSETALVPSSCELEGVLCSVYPVVQPFNPGYIDCFVPNDLIIGRGDLKRPNGDFYKVDFEMGSIVLEIPATSFSADRTLDLMSDFIVDYTGTGITRLGFPAMKFSDCSSVSNNALVNNQIRFSISIQSYSPTPDGYTVDNSIGVSLDPTTGLLTLNFNNLYQDAVLATLSTKVQINVFLKQSGFNNMPLFVDSTKVENMLNLISVFSGPNVGGPSALLDLTNDTTGVLPIVHGGTGLNTMPSSPGYVLVTTGTGLVYTLLTAAIPYTPAVPGNWSTVPTTVGQALDLIAAHIAPV